MDEKNEKTTSKKAVNTTYRENSIDRFKSAFFADKKENVMSNLFSEIFIPGVKRIISEAVTNGIDMLLFGGTRRRDSGRSGVTYISYDRFADRYSVKSDRDYKPSKASDRSVPGEKPMYSIRDYMKFGFDTRPEAYEVLMDLQAIRKRYGFVKVSDFYDTIEKVGDPSTYNYCWFDLDNVDIEYDHGKFYIKFPKISPID